MTGNENPPAGGLNTDGLGAREPDSGRHYLHFSGELGAYFGIALVNLLLTIVTLGIYRFWAKTRIRKYLWSGTEVMGERLEYTGTGGELFLGFLIVLVAIFVPLVFLFTIAQALLLSAPLLGGLLILLIYVIIIYLAGVALYRMQRYRLSRTLWRGIRGGMAAKGWRFGLSSLGVTLLSIVTLGLYAPIGSIKLWKLRMADSSFGNFKFHSDPKAAPLYAPVIATALLLAALIGTLLSVGPVTNPTQVQAVPGYFWVVVPLVYLGLVVASLWFLAVYHRETLGNLHLGNDLHFHFDASVMNWLAFYIVNVLLVVFTLGIGALFLPYRYWGFWTKYLTLSGTLDPTLLHQSQEEAPATGEGLAEAFDMGAI